GIPYSRQKQIFEMGIGDGSGLGLSNVSERLVGLYGSAYRLRLKSRPQHGTSLRIVIPSDNLSANAAASHTASSPL
ncbi:MAG: sensor histidine kinase, partial [Firmicutes bacterium]|nr:sensor histidine kinase [Bacillota bacterium]